MEFINNQLTARELSKIFSNAGCELTMRTIRKARNGETEALKRVREAADKVDRNTVQKAIEKITIKIESDKGEAG